MRVENLLGHFDFYNQKFFVFSLLSSSRIGSRTPDSERSTNGVVVTVRSHVPPRHCLLLLFKIPAARTLFHHASADNSKNPPFIAATFSQLLNTVMSDSRSVTFWGRQCQAAFSTPAQTNVLNTHSSHGFTVS